MMKCSTTVHLVGALALLLAASQARLHAAEYVVAADGSGDFTTIDQCVQAMQGGDICTVAPGTYPERIRIPARLSGTAEQKTIFRASHSRQAVMQGFDTWGADFVRIEGFQITNTYTTLDGFGILIRTDNVEVVGNYLHNLTGTAIAGFWRVPWQSNVWVVDNQIYRCRSGIGIVGQNWLVENNTIERLFQHIDYDCDYTRFFGENIIIRNNIMRGTIRSEIGDAHVDGFQTYDDNGEYAKNVLIEGNRISDCHQGMMAEARYHQQHENIVVRNNIFSRCWAWGLDLHSIRNIEVSHNIFFDMGLHGIGYRTGSTGTCKNNIFYTSIYWKDDVSTVDSRNNLLFKPGKKWRQSDFPLDIVNQDPLFMNPAAGNFYLKTDSPAIDAGWNLGILRDFEYRQRPTGSAFDIGPFEYVLRTSARGWKEYK